MMYTCTYSVSDCTSRQNPSGDRHRDHEVPPLAKDLLAIDDYCMRKRLQIFYKVAHDMLFMFKWMAIHPCIYWQH